MEFMCLCIWYILTNSRGLDIDIQRLGHSKTRLLIPLDRLKHRCNLAIVCARVVFDSLFIPSQIIILMNFKGFCFQS